MILQRLSLKNFRNYLGKDLLFSSYISIVSGENGIGKTNLMESISLLEKPKGLRGGALEDMQNNTTQDFWSVQYTFQERDITITCTQGKKKIYSLNRIIPHTKVHEFIKVLWLGPQNDRIFSGSPEHRRKFFDTVLSIFDPEYKTIQNKYLHYIFERTKLLYNNEDPQWINIVEQKIYDYGALWIQKRSECMAVLNQYLSQIQNIPPVFLKANEKDFSKELLMMSREKDSVIGGCGIGPHKTDYTGTYAEKNLHLCSNGEQSLGQISVFLAIIFYMMQTRYVVFLMDEIFSYLDSGNKMRLINELKLMTQQGRSQVLITLPKLEQIYEGIQYLDL